MSITRIWQAGAEVGTTAELETPGSAVIITTASVKTGTYSFRLAKSAASNAQFTKNIAASSTRQIRLGLSINEADESNGGALWLEVIRIRDSSNNVLIEVEADQVNGNFRLNVGGAEQDITADSPITLGNFFHLGIDCKIDSSAGWAYVYFDGNLILSFDGNTGNVDINNILFGTTTDSGSSGGLWYYDDIYIDNSTGEGSPDVLSILRFYRVIPNASGNYSQWLGSDGDSTNNYQLVDEIPPSDSDYVVTTGTNNLDSYNMTTFTLGVGEVINAVIPTVRAKRTSSTEQIILGGRVSSTDLLGVVQDPSSSFDYIFERLTGTPAGASWQQSDLDGYELLMASTGTY